MLVLTEESNTSNEVMRELTIAGNYNKKLYCLQIDKLNISDGIIYYCAAVHRNEAYKIGVDKALQKMANELSLNLKTISKNEESLNPIKETEIIKKAETISKIEKVTKEELGKLKRSGNWIDSRESGLGWISCLFWVIVIARIWAYFHYFTENPEFKSYIKDGEEKLDGKIYFWAKFYFLKAYKTPNITGNDSIKAATLIGFCDYKLKKYDIARINLYSLIAKDNKNSEAYLYLGYIMGDNQKNDGALYIYSKSIEADSTNSFRAYFNRAILKQKLNDKTASEDFKKAKKN